jgi:hypothetical protein
MNLSNLAEQSGFDSDPIRYMPEAEGIEPIGRLGIVQVSLNRSLPATWGTFTTRPSCTIPQPVQPTSL